MTEGRRARRGAAGDVDVGAIIERLKKATGTETDIDLATQLNVSKATVSSWRNRGSIPIAECIRVALSQGVALDWLILGKGPERLEFPRLPSSNIDHEVLAVCIFESLGPIVRNMAERWAFARQLARRFTLQYDRYFKMQREAAEAGAADSHTFVRALQQAVEAEIRHLDDQDRELRLSHGGRSRRR